MTEAELPTKARVIIDFEYDGEEVHVNITARPLVSVHAIVQLFESTAAELKAGNLQSIRIGPLSRGKGEDDGE